MRYNNYQSDAYPRRNPSRRPLRNQVAEKPEFGKRLMEEFLTQFMICTLVTGLIFGAQFFKNPKINKNVAKVKLMITYSPSLKEIANEAKEGTSALIEKISFNDRQANDPETNTKELPMIIVDDEIF